MISVIFSAVDAQIAVLVSTAKAWISAPDTQTSVFLGLLGKPLFLVCHARGKFVPRRLSPKLGSQHQLHKNKTTVKQRRVLLSLPRSAATPQFLKGNCCNSACVASLSRVGVGLSGRGRPCDHSLEESIRLSICRSFSSVLLSCYHCLIAALLLAAGLLWRWPPCLG